MKERGGRMGKWKVVWGTEFKRMGGWEKKTDWGGRHANVIYGCKTKWHASMRVTKWKRDIMREKDLYSISRMWSHSAESDASYMSQWKVNGQERNTGIRTESFFSAKQLKKWQVLKGRERAKIFIIFIKWFIHLEWICLIQYIVIYWKKAKT